MARSSSLGRRVGFGVVLALAGCAGGTDGVSTTAEELSSRSVRSLNRCATVEPGAVEADAADAVAARVGGLLADRARTTRIPVYVHVITSSTGEGDVSALVPAQIDVLNAAYAVAGFRFQLAAIEVTANDAWYTATIDSKEEKQMKRALRRGDAGTLNVYTGVNDGTLLGWATFPSSFQGHPNLDGIVVLNVSLPGGGLEIPDDPSEEPDGLIVYDRGDTLTHETGHWLGLFHTFENGCTKKGDRIDDTPAEAEPQFFCVDRDSCTGRKFPGTDPIHNFMDYVDDDCMDQFTGDQTDRMRAQYAAFRAP
jgi:hypothetical protein